MRLGVPNSYEAPKLWPVAAGRVHRPRLQIQRNEAAASERGYRRLRSQADPEDEAHLIIRFAFGAGGLGEGGYGSEPAVAAVRNIWAEEEIVFRFRAMPGR